jgi:hypothetical protein
MQLQPAELVLEDPLLQSDVEQLRVEILRHRVYRRDDIFSGEDVNRIGMVGDIFKQDVDGNFAEGDSLHKCGFFLDGGFVLGLDGVHGIASRSKRYV